MQHPEIRALVEIDLASLDQLIVEQLRVDVPLIQHLATHIIESGGKRLRPLLVILVARALGYSASQHCCLAAIIEFVHTATLLHDDVVDGSDLRRGRKTANHIWGNEASVLVGDFLYSRSFQMMVMLQDLRIMSILANATNIIAKGEVLQLLSCRNWEMAEADYMRIISNKTATLFSAAAETAAIIAGATSEQQQALADYGLYLGIAFQLLDDILDYQATSEQWGKKQGHDLAEGKLTLPLIYALKHGSATEQALFKDAITAAGDIDPENFARIRQTIESTGGIAYTYDRAAAHTERALAALSVLPASSYHDALCALARLAVQRTY